MFAHYKKATKRLITFMVVGLFFAILASSASASNPFKQGWLHQPGVQGGVSEAKSSSTVVVLQDVKLKGAEVNSPKCHWMNGYNSGETATGELYWFWDEHMYVCPNKNSPTGQTKVGGGMTGRNCGNPVKAGSPPAEKVKIIILRTFGKFKAVANAHAREKVKGSCGVAEATASAHGMAYGMTRVQAKNNAKFVANAKAKATAYAKAKVMLVCSPPAASPPPLTPPAEIVCGINQVKNAMGNCVNQSNTAEQNCEVMNGTFNGSNQLCTIIQINANCSNVTIVNGSGNVVETKQEGNCNVTPPPCTTNCHPEPPDNGPQIGCTFPPHIYVGGSQFFWCQASDPDGDAVSVAINGDSHATVASVITVNEQWDGSSCPSGVKCYRATLWGKTAGMAHIIAKATANGKSVEVDGEVSVEADEF